MNLLQIEFRKLLPYRAFWVLLLLFVGLLALVINSAQHIQLNGKQLGSGPFTFPEIFQNVAWLASYLNLLLGILIIVIVTDEFQFRTFRQQIIDGLTRLQLVLAKGSVVVLVAFICALVVGVLSFVYGYLSDKPFTNEATSELSYIGTYFVQAVAYMSLALFIGILFRKSGLSIVVFLLYTCLLEPVIRGRLPDSLDKYLPMKVLDTLTPKPIGLQQVAEAAGMTNELLPMATAVTAAVLYSLLFFALSYLVLKVRDL
jgi:ABC-2 type transport system permease protein